MEPKLYRLKPSMFLLCTSLWCFSQSVQATSVRRKLNPVPTTTASTSPDLSGSTSLKKPMTANSQFSGSWTLGLKSVNVDSKSYNQNQIEVALEATIDYRLTSWIKLEFRPKVSLQTAHSDNILDDSKPANGMSLLKGAAEIETRPIDVSAGAINMVENHSTLLIGDRAFPGARVYGYALKSPTLELAAGGEAAIPSGSSLSTKATSLEPVPGFSSFGVRGRVGEDKKTFIYARGQTYKYTNLPSTVAQGSALFGNTVNKINAQTSKFAYEFEGYEARLKGGVSIADFIYPEVTGDYVKNSKAPESLSNASAVKVALRQDYGNIEFTPFLKGYRLEPDAAPVFYTDYTHTNNQGLRTGLELTFKKLFFKVTAFYDDNHPIYYDPYVTPEKIYYLSVETLDATF